MNGSVLLDTNIVIGLLNGETVIASESPRLANISSPQSCSVSSSTAHTNPGPSKLTSRGSKNWRNEGQFSCATNKRRMNTV